MGVVHFLNVREGDCSIIQHTSGRITVIDICNGNSPTPVETGLFEHVYDTILGNYHQKEYPVNPITYLKLMGVENIWRFILTHPDMDHMDGLNQLCNEFKVYNFWDTGNKKKWGHLTVAVTKRKTGIDTRRLERKHYSYMMEQ